MCEKCEQLKRTKVGFKTKVKITDQTEMILDRYKDHFEVFIHSVDVDPHDGSWLNYPFDITHCPFCGEKIEPFGEGGLMSNNGYVNERDAKRIANDAFIAMECLQGIVVCGSNGDLHPGYIHEKLKVVRRSLEFIERFEEKENET